MSISNRFAVLAVLTLVAAISSAVAQTKPRLPEGRPLVTPGVEAFALTGNGAGKATPRRVPVVDQAFDAAWRVQMRERVGADYDVQLAAVLKELPGKGDVVWMTAYARLIDTADESGAGRIGLVFEPNADPYDKIFESFGVTRQWQRFDVPATVTRDLMPTGAHVIVRLGASVQTLQIGVVALRQMPAGTDAKMLPRTLVGNAGREPDASWRKAAAERIERIRKADLVVNVVDAAGKPAPDASVAVRMTRHAFVFGSCYSPPRILDTQSEDNKKYREMFLANFNTGVDEFAMKWPGWVERGIRQIALDALKWMDDHGIAVRGHTMVWPGWERIAASIKELAGDPAKLEAAIVDRIKMFGEALRGRVIDWDVVNEPFVNHDLMDVVGDDKMVDWFKAARATKPTATLYLNETSVPTSPPNDERYTALYDRVWRDPIYKQRGRPSTERRTLTARSRRAASSATTRSPRRAAHTR